MQEALNLGRKFIGIDESIEAIKLNQKWLKASENHLFSHDIALIESGFLQEALNLGRKFIGIDESIEAIKLNQKWLKASENHLFSHDIALIEKLTCQ